jgi:hypothetical protein
VHYFANGPKSFPKERLEVFAAGRALQLDNFRKLTGFGWPGFGKMNLWRQDKGQKGLRCRLCAGVETGGESPIPLGELIEVARISIEQPALFRRPECAGWQRTGRMASRSALAVGARKSAGDGFRMGAVSLIRHRCASSIGSSGRWQAMPSAECVHSLAVQARHLSRRLEYHLLGNHLFANAKALVFAGLFFQGDEADAWLADGHGDILRIARCRNRYSPMAASSSAARCTTRWRWRMCST